MPRIRAYRPSDWTAFIELDLQTGTASLHGSTATERSEFRARWPEVLKSRFAWADTGPTTAGSALVVLEDDSGAYAGHLWLSELEDLFTGSIALFVTTIAIASAYRGRGWGRLLMEHAIKEANARGLKSVRLGVDCNNAGARRLYESLGFEPIRMTMAKSLG